MERAANRLERRRQHLRQSLPRRGRQNRRDPSSPYLELRRGARRRHPLWQSPAGPPPLPHRLHRPRAHLGKTHRHLGTSRPPRMALVRHRPRTRHPARARRARRAIRHPCESLAGRWHLRRARHHQRRRGRKLAPQRRTRRRRERKLCRRTPRWRADFQHSDADPFARQPRNRPQQ